MKVAGGNLPFLFSSRSLKQLQDALIATTKKIVPNEIPAFYFEQPTSGTKDRYHRPFASFPKEPFDEPGEVGYVSDFVEKLLQEVVRN
jgi:hypothetical protein